MLNQFQPAAKSQNTDGFEQELRLREKSRIEGETFERITYLNGQQITVKLVEIKRPHFMEPLFGEGTVTVAVTETKDLRTGRVSNDSPFQGGTDFSGKEEPHGYPEITEFANALRKQMAGSKLQFHEPSIFAIPAVALGHGNMHPLALLHPKVIAAIAKDTIFPVHREHGFDLEKGKNSAQREGNHISETGVLAGYDGFVARISSDRYSFEDCGAFSPHIEVQIFNPAILKRTEKKDDYQRTVPSADNSIYSFSVSPQHEVVRFLSTRPYAAQKFNAIDEVSLEKINDDHRDHSFYVKIDRAFVEMLAQIAPLPVQYSDCGAKQGLLELNKKFELEREQAWASQQRINALKENTAAINLLTEESFQQDNVANVEYGTRMLIRSRAQRSQSGALEVVKEHKIIPPRLVDSVRELLQISDNELRSIAKIPEVTTAFQIELAL